MVDTREDEMSGGIGWGGVVIDCFKTIFSHKNRAAGEAQIETARQTCSEDGSEQFAVDEEAEVPLDEEKY